MIILVDVDSVVCDIMTPWLFSYNHIYHDNLTKEKITEWDMTKFVKPECGRKIYKLLGGLYELALPIEGSREGVQKLRDMGHTVYFVTASREPEQPKWLASYDFITYTNGQYREHIVSPDKNMIKGDAIIDDNVDTLKNYSGVPIVFDQPWNQNYSTAFRMNYWGKVEAILNYVEIGAPF